MNVNSFHNTESKNNSNLIFLILERSFKKQSHDTCIQNIFIFSNVFFLLNLS